MSSTNHSARATDPSTSHEAAGYVVSSGLQTQQQACALAAVRQHPGLTSAELSQASGLDRFMLARRLPELLEAELVCHGEARKCAVSGRRAMTWDLVSAGDPNEAAAA
ncbi:winged helix-turn-helix domain-containing protein [Stenotrophomonas sp. TWI819]|uniref:winged helix-turn-helix domain-containing protein n=1 Tax=Stenotrophomonas sp. TWI819 TaxID=3136800 RepID=UPI0032080FAF